MEDNPIDNVKNKKVSKKTKNEVVKKKGFELDLNNHSQGQVFFDEMIKAPKGTQDEMLSSLFSEKTIIAYLQMYLQNPNPKKTVLDFCSVNFIPLSEYTNIVSISDNKKLRYLHELLVTLHKNKLYNQLEDSGKLPFISGAIAVLARQFGEDKDHAQTQNNIVINFRGVSTKEIDNINKGSDILNKNNVINDSISSVDSDNKEDE